MTWREGPTSERHGIDPLEMAVDAVNEAWAMIQTGRKAEARVQFRQRLEGIVRYMCPMCGKTGDHEDNDHRWVAPKQKTLGDTRHLIGGREA
jgi:hypothetical protein